MLQMHDLWQPVFQKGCAEKTYQIHHTEMTVEDCRIVRGINLSIPKHSYRGIHIIFFLFLLKNICCGYSLEVPWWGASNEYPQHMFSWRNKKDISIFRMKKAPYQLLYPNPINQQNGYHHQKIDLDRSTVHPYYATTSHWFLHKTKERPKFKNVVWTQPSTGFGNPPQKNYSKTSTLRHKHQHHLPQAPSVWMKETHKKKLKNWTFLCIIVLIY